MVTMPNIEDFNNADYDPFEAELFAFGDLLDIHGAIAKLRREKGDVIPGTFLELVGVRPDDSPPTFTLLAYDDVANALLDYENFTNAVFHTTLGRTFGNTLSLMEPPGHTQYRRLFQKAFLPQNIARWGTEIVDVVVDELIGKFRGRGEADLIEEFTKRYPFEIIYRQLALPEGDGPIFHRLASSQLMPQTTEGQEAAGKLGTYFKALLDERRRNPGPDLASALVTAEIEGEQLPEDVVISFLRQLIAAAGDTTFRATSVTLTGLLTNPDQLDAVKADRSLIPQTVEEGLRWETPTSWTERTAARDMVVGGVAIPAGATVLPVLVAANCDERYFERGNTFNIFRKNVKPPINFALGPHICLGRHLARLEVSRALEALFDRLPNLRLDPEKPAPEIRGAMLRYPRHLFVRFD